MAYIREMIYGNRCQNFIIANGISFASVNADGPFSAWGNVPVEGKLQILLLIFCLELASESKKPHYMRVNGARHRGCRAGGCCACEAIDGAYRRRWPALILRAMLIRTVIATKRRAVTTEVRPAQLVSQSFLLPPRRSNRLRADATPLARQRAKRLGPRPGGYR